MAEEGIVVPSGQPVMGKGAGAKVFFLPVCKDYTAIAASQSTAALGATGAKGDYLEGVLVIPATTSPGVVTIIDNVTAVVSFPGGASSVADLKPFFIPVKAFSTSGKWNVTTGANVSVVGVGSFT